MVGASAANAVTTKSTKAMMPCKPCQRPQGRSTDRISQASRIAVALAFSFGCSVASYFRAGRGNGDVPLVPLGVLGLLGELGVLGDELVLFRLLMETVLPLLLTLLLELVLPLLLPLLSELRLETEEMLLEELLEGHATPCA